MVATMPQPEPEDGPLSPWWIRAILIVMVFGFATQREQPVHFHAVEHPERGPAQDRRGACCVLFEMPVHRKLVALDSRSRDFR